jgi:hypothetical protein
MLTLDTKGIHFRRWVVSRRLVWWDDIQGVSTSIRIYRFAKTLIISGTLTARAQRARGGKGELTIGLAQSLITVPLEEVAERVSQRFHARRPHAVERAIRLPRL